MGSHGPRDASEPEIDVVSGGISEALVTTALGLFVDPCGDDVQLFHHQSKSL